MLFGRLSGLLRTLRFRLLIGNTLVLVLMVVPTLVGVREYLLYALRQEFDRILEEDTLEVRLALAQYYPDWDKFYQAMDRKSQGHAHHGWFVQLFEPDGRPVWASPNSPAVGPPVLDAAVTFLSDSESYRLAQAPPERGGAPALIIRVGSSRQDLDEDVALLTRTMLLAGGGILVLAPLGGYWLASRATRPLARIIDTTARLRPSNLDERLPLSQTGDELDRLAGTINGLLNRIAAYLEQKRDFIANAAHELRSPVAAIRSSSEVALNAE